MDKYLVIGLGNPGFRYRRTRHNMGFMVVEYLSEKYGIKMKKTKCMAIIGEGKINNCDVILAKPQTYMNNSGQSVKELLQYFKIPLTNLIIIYDDMDIDLGKLRIRKKGSSGSHNGMKSIIYHIKAEEFIRIRLGIGDKKNSDAKVHVLSRFSKDDSKIAFSVIEKCAEATVEIFNNGIDSSMNRYNK